MAQPAYAGYPQAPYDYYSAYAGDGRGGQYPSYSSYTQDPSYPYEYDYTRGQWVVKPNTSSSATEQKQPEPNPPLPQDPPPPAEESAADAPPGAPSPATTAPTPTTSAPSAAGYPSGYNYNAYYQQQYYGQQQYSYPYQQQPSYPGYDASYYPQNGYVADPHAASAHPSPYGPGRSATEAALRAHPPSANGVASAAQGAAAGATTASEDFSRMPPPSSLAAKPSFSIKPNPSVKQGTHWGPKPSTAGTAAAANAPHQQVFEAAKAAAAARAAALRGGGSTPSPSKPSLAIPVSVPATAAVTSGLSRAAAAANAAAAAAQAQAAAAAAPGAAGLPPGIRPYTYRCLTACKTQEDKDWMKETLKAMISEMRESGTLWTVDWDRKRPPERPKPEPSTSGSDKDNQDHMEWEREGPRGNKRSRNWVRERDGSDRDSGDEGMGGWGRDGGRGAGGRGGKGGRGSGGKLSKKQQKFLAKQQQQQQKGGKVWSAQESNKRAKREERFGAVHGPGLGDLAGPENAPAGLGYADFADRYAYTAYKKRQVELASADGALDLDALEEFAVKGTSTKLEKRYLRLTSAPNPAEVRPEAVLRQALARLVAIVAGRQPWPASAGKESQHYFYLNDQLKAIRQDLTVQHIKNEFTVQVYEVHGRAALEYGDFSEYNQCQTKLAQLYADGHPGCHAEFTAYRLLYQTVHIHLREGRKLLGTMGVVLANREVAVAGSPEVQHALKVREALATGKYRQFFELYRTCPHLGRALLDVAAGPLRWKALNVLVRSHKPTNVPLSLLATTLGFYLPPQATAASTAGGAGVGSSSKAGVVQQLAGLGVGGGDGPTPGCSRKVLVGECVCSEEQQQGLAAALAWAKAHGAEFDKEEDVARCVLVTKTSAAQLSIPEDSSKVAHGDANLGYEDFLAAL